MLIKRKVFQVGRWEIMVQTFYIFGYMRVSKIMQKYQVFVFVYRNRRKMVKFMLVVVSLLHFSRVPSPWKYDYRGVHILHFLSIPLAKSIFWDNCKLIPTPIFVGMVVLPNSLGYMTAAAVFPKTTKWLGRYLRILTSTWGVPTGFHLAFSSYLPN